MNDIVNKATDALDSVSKLSAVTAIERCSHSNQYIVSKLLNGASKEYKKSVFDSLAEQFAPMNNDTDKVALSLSSLSAAGAVNAIATCDHSTQDLVSALIDSGAMEFGAEHMVSKLLESTSKEYKTRLFDSLISEVEPIKTFFTGPDQPLQVLPEPTNANPDPLPENEKAHPYANITIHFDKLALETNSRGQITTLKLSIDK